MTDTPFEPTYDEIFFEVNEKEHCVEETILAKLLVDGILFVGDFDSGPFFESRQAKDENVTVCLWVNCNDVFYYACADSETVLTKELPELYKMHIEDLKWGSIKWACKKRNMRPVGRIVERMKKDGSWCDLMKSLPK